MTVTYTSRLGIQERVLIDGDEDLEGVVMELNFTAYGPEPQVKVGWIHNGEVKEAWFPEWRLATLS